MYVLDRRDIIIIAAYELGRIDNFQARFFRKFILHKLHFSSLITP